MNKGIIFPIAVLIVAVVLAVGYYFYFSPQAPVSTEPYHVHADFLVIINGTKVDFNKPQYMSVNGKELTPDVHMHDNIPFVIHFHSATADLKEFFKSLGMDFNSNCFFDGNNTYCTNATERLQFYVNGSPSPAFGDYRPNDLDKILIYYGSSSPAPGDFASITSWACVYSKKCPAPPGFVLDETSCAGQNFCPA